MSAPIVFSALLTGAVLLPAAPVLAASVSESGMHAVSADNYYKRHAEGWYWYQDPEPEEKTKPKIPDPPKTAEEPPKEERPVEEAKTQEPAKPAPVPQEKPLSAKWVRDMLPKYKDLMWSDPTPENVKAYFLLQRFAIDRSQKVAEVAQQVTLGNPLLDETFRRPTSSFGINAVDRTAGAHMDALLKKIATKAGLFFFFKSDCGFCEAEAPLVGMLEKESGFDVLAISIDGGVLRRHKFENVRMNAGHAQMLGVTATPALFLVSGDGKFEALGQGLLSVPELQRRIVVAAFRQGWITEANMEKTKPIINPESQIDLSRELPNLLLAEQNPVMAWGDARQSEAVASLPSEVTTKLADETGFIAPDKLLALFNGAGTDGQFDPSILTSRDQNEAIQH